jgi:ABC-type amino acid transport substrate-binding protein
MILKNVNLPLYFLTLFLIALFFYQPSFADTVKDNQAFARIKSTSTIRCGYFPWPTLLEIDLKTKTFSGLAVDYMDAIAQATNLTYTWDAELQTQSYVIDLDNHKIDVACGALASGAEVGLNVFYTEPLFYATINTYVADPKKFGTPTALNQTSTRFAVVEGSAVETMMKALYPKGTYVTVSQLQGPTQALLEVTTGKADAIVMDSMTVGMFVKNNPGALTQVQQPTLSVIGAAMAVSTQEPKLLASLNMIIQDLKDKGTIKGLIEKYKLTGYLLLQAP